MKVDLLFAPQALSGQRQPSLFLPGDRDFLARLELGQILEGRVLSRSAGGHYLVDFQGQRKMVDSPVPLGLNDLLRGRVVSLGDRIELQRLQVPDAGSDAAAADPLMPSTGAASAAAAQIRETFRRHLGSLDRAQFIALEAQVARAGDPARMALGGLFLRKLGLPMAAEFLQAAYALLEVGHGPGVLPALDALVDVDGAAARPSAIVAADLERALGALAGSGLALRSGEANAATRGTASGTAGGVPNSAAEVLAAPLPGTRSHTLERWLLNAQVPGAVSHRIGTLPLLIDGQLTELDVVAFDQSADAAAGVAHRSLAFAVVAPALGRVEMRALMDGPHMRLEVLAGATAIDALAARSAELSEQLGEAGWRVDELRYVSAAAANGSGNALVAQVVEHVIAAGSVSRLL